MVFKLIRIIISFYLLGICLCFIREINKGNRKDKKLKNGIIRKTLEQSLYGDINELNYYYINLYLGKNKKKQSFLLDTGSGITSIPCKPYCNQCGQHINSYIYINENQIIFCNNEECSSVESNCDKNIQKEDNYCSFEIYYSEKSVIKGIYFNELINFSKKNINNFDKYIPIGCTIYEDNLFYTQKVDGIMGLCNNGNNFINTLYKYGVINNNIFSLCFGDKGGYTSIDKIETKYHKEKISYINIDKENNYYNIYINKINIKNNNRSIVAFDNITYSAILDSGLTLTNMPKNIANDIINYIKDICKDGKCGVLYHHKEFDLCYKFNSLENLTYVVDNIWPNISFYINNNYYEYVWRPSQYIFKFNENNEIIGCIGFIKNRANVFNLGASWMIGHDIIFDNQNNRIGFAEADCNQISNNVEEDMEKPLFNNNNYINIFENKFEKILFIFYILVIFILCLIILIFCFCIFNLRRGKKCFFLNVKTNVENDFIEHNFKDFRNDNDINEQFNRFSTFIEMNNK